MAERRMFAKTIVLSDAFLDMPLSARCLYFTLGMLADDDGFVNAPKSIMRQCGASEDDLNLLLIKKFVLSFDDGVIVIKHWRINNYLRNDRYTETQYIKDKQTLSIDDKGTYHKQADSADTEVGYTNIGYTEDGYPQDRSVKDSPVKGSRKEKADVFSDFAGDDAELLSALKDFEKMRKENDRPMSDRAKSMLLNKLQTFPRNEWIKILEQSIFHCWQGIFPLKDDGNTFTGSKTSKTAEMLSDSYNMMKEWATDDSKS